MLTLGHNCTSYNSDFGNGTDVPNIEPSGLCYVADPTRLASSYDCDRVPDTAGELSGKQRLCNCDDTPPPTPAPTLDPTPEPCVLIPNETAIVGEGNVSCTAACAAIGKQCTVPALACLNEFSDSEAELGALMMTLGHNCTSYNSLYGNATDVPNIQPEGTCYVADPNRLNSTYDCDRIPDFGGELIGKQRLCNCEEGLAPTPAPEYTPGCDVTPGVTAYIGEGNQSCTDACADEGMQCTQEALYCLNEYTDSQAGVGALVSALGETCLFYNELFGSATDVPNRHPDGTCYVSDTTRLNATYDCDRVPDETGVLINKRRICNCEAASAPAVTDAPITVAPTTDPTTIAPTADPTTAPTAASATIGAGASEAPELEVKTAAEFSVALTSTEQETLKQQYKETLENEYDFTVDTVLLDQQRRGVSYTLTATGRANGNTVDSTSSITEGSMPASFGSVFTTAIQTSLPGNAVVVTPIAVTVAASTSSGEDSGTLYMIIGALGGVLLMLLIGIAVYCIWFRNKATASDDAADKPGAEIGESSSTQADDATDEDSTMSSFMDVHTKDSAALKWQPSQPLTPKTPSITQTISAQETPRSPATDFLGGTPLPPIPDKLEDVTLRTSLDQPMIPLAGDDSAGLSMEDYLSRMLRAVPEDTPASNVTTGSTSSSGAVKKHRRGSEVTLDVGTPRTPFNTSADSPSVEVLCRGSEESTDSLDGDSHANFFANLSSMRNRERASWEVNIGEVGAKPSDKPPEAQEGSFLSASLDKPNQSFLDASLTRTDTTLDESDEEFVLTPRGRTTEANSTASLVRGLEVDPETSHWLDNVTNVDTLMSEINQEINHWRELEADVGAEGEEEEEFMELDDMPHTCEVCGSGFMTPLERRMHQKVCEGADEDANGQEEETKAMYL
eukprot:TRINITY_DN3355_c0_g1_i11.p1 TRINITY_DN3355_c0_g1~~TRINITY_DN3355_c0_g1_i11.p1  ORF type:complete len:905 (+),score=154.69 TRINITY_DN3355_c0_g1_i11:3250-5964(+)